MPRPKAAKPRQPLNESTLAEMALRYVGRFATTRAKLKTYLERKLRERGWDAATDPPIASLIERFSAQGYIDDAGYALSKSRALSARGYGAARLRQSLRAAGIDEADSVAAREHAEGEAIAAALRFAKRRRIGPFAAERPDEKLRQKAIAAMIRAGHGFALARTIVALEPGAELDAMESGDQRPKLR